MHAGTPDRRPSAARPRQSPVTTGSGGRTSCYVVCLAMTAPRPATLAVLGSLLALLAAAASRRTLDAALADDGQWVRPAKDLAATRYSSLDQVTAANVKTLRLAWSFDLGVERGEEAAPLVVGDTMYVVTPFPNVLYAFDLTRPGTVRWKYEPTPATEAQGVACCDVVTRGAAYADGLVVFNTLVWWNAQVQRRIDHRRKRVEAELRESEVRHRAVVEQASEGITLVDADTLVVIEANHALAKMLGYKVEELIGATIFLASDAASFVTGHLLVVDGGFLASGVNP